MRYLIINYYRRPNGQMDELVTVSKKTKMADAVSAAVILDFKSRRVEKAHLDGVTLDKNWDRVVNYYYQFYPQIIDQLMESNGHQMNMQVNTSADGN